MKRKPLEILRGLAMFLVFWAAALMAVRLQLFFPRPVIIFLSQSTNPQQALVAFCALVSSGSLALFRLGIEVPMVKPLFSAEQFRTYITGIPVWVLGTIFAISAGILLFIFPACQAPTFITFSVQGRSETYQPGDTLTVSPNEFLAITSVPFQDNSVLSCKWQYIGEVFQSIGSSSGCQVILKLSGAPGTGLLTLQASQGFCNQSSVFSLNIKVDKP